MEYPLFQRYIGIDYSGAKTPDASLSGLRVYEANRDSVPVEVEPPPSPRKYWTRRGLAQWLAQRLREDVPTIVGIDHGFSFPLQYFKKHNIEQDWPTFLDDFQKHWPTDGQYIYVDCIREGLEGDDKTRTGSAKWRRLTETRAGAKSVFHFDVPGSVAKSTHAGLPYLRYLRNELNGQLHFWPFDGWDLPSGKSVLAEVYPSLWSKSTPEEGRTSDQHDAYVVAACLQQMDIDGSLGKFLKPDMLPDEYPVAQVEGWILGVM